MKEGMNERIDVPAEEAEEEPSTADTAPPNVYFLRIWLSPSPSPSSPPPAPTLPTVAVETTPLPSFFDEKEPGFPERSYEMIIVI